MQDDKQNTYTFGHIELETDGRPPASNFKKFCAAGTSVVIGIAVAITVAIVVIYPIFKKGTSVSSSSSSAVQYNSNITVYYASSLDDILSNVINPQFQSKYNIRVNTLSDSSGNLAKKLKTGAFADVFISADSKINAALLPIMLPSSSIPVIRWYTLWASTSLGIGYNSQSIYAPQFESIANGSKLWFDVLSSNSQMKIGRTDPDSDPKGYRTVIMARLAEIYYNTPGIALKVLGPPRNGQQIHTEARLELQLASNDIDVGFFYDCEQSWSNTGNLRFIPLPVEINMSNRTLNPYYAKANYTNSVTKLTTFGSAVVYAISIPSTSLNTDGAVKYIQNIVSTGLQLVLSEGMKELGTSSVYYGNVSAVPPLLYNFKA